MDSTLIPFALRQADRTLVGIDEVPIGKACGCICPSCGSRLLARQGARRVWHFAHEPRADGQATDRACEFSWAVSVRLMARQLLPTLPSLLLPPAVFPLFTDGLSRRQPEPTVALTTPDILPLEQTSIDAVVEGLAVDALVSSIEGPWCLYLTHGGRPVPDRLSALATLGYRAIAINLHGFSEKLPRRELPGSHRDALAAFLVHDIAHKYWAAHPGLAEARAEAQDLRMPFQTQRPPPKPWERAMIERRRERYPSLQAAPSGCGTPSEPSLAALSPTPFVCLACEHRWSSYAKVPPCPHCGQRYAGIPEQP
jgi:hypothetical protein